jgi:hypothetical protein
VLFGYATLVEDVEEKIWAMELITNVSPIFSKEKVPVLLFLDFCCNYAHETCFTYF